MPLGGFEIHILGVANGEPGEIVSRQSFGTLGYRRDVLLFPYFAIEIQMADGSGRLRSMRMEIDVTRVVGSRGECYQPCGSKLDTRGVGGRQFRRAPLDAP